MIYLISGMDMPEAMATTEEPGGDHARGAVLLSGSRPRRNAVSPYLGVTLDQLVARKYGQDTILSSLQDSDVNRHASCIFFISQVCLTFCFCIDVLIAFSFILEVASYRHIFMAARVTTTTMRA